MTDQAQTLGLTPEQQHRLNYQRGLEQFIATFHEAHGIFQDAQDLLKNGDVAGARTAIAKCQPEKVIEQFARFSSIGGNTRGEQGLVVSLNTRWLSHIVGLRQALALEPVRIRFAPTSHDMLAQARGTLTFYFGPDHDVWQCWGEQETGASVITLPPSSPATNSSTPAAWSEVCRNGIEITKPFKLTLRPFMMRSQPLPPGDYRLRLLVVDPDSTGPGQRVFEVKVASFAADRVDVFSRAGGTNRIVELVYPVTLKTAGAVDVSLTPMKGKAILCAVVTEPAGQPTQTGTPEKTSP